MVEESIAVTENREGGVEGGAGAAAPPDGDVKEKKSNPGPEEAREENAEPGNRGAGLSTQDSRLQTAFDMQTSLEKVRGELAEATTRYRGLVLALHPEIPPELIAGASLAEIDASVDKASALVEKIRASILRRGSVPAGSPARSAVDWSSLSARDKIKAGIGRRSQ
ncbi:MAG: hypothetical protein HY673_04000 [Chloroflexi bacterium]|nr:hypothetical protein [Chloroflexota bacterium]